MFKGTKRFKINPETLPEYESVARFGDVWEKYPGIAVTKPDHTLLSPPNSDHIKWWPTAQIEAIPIG